MTQFIELLRSEPNHEDLIDALRLWTGEKSAFSRLTVQDALVARTIVKETLPSFWPVIRQNAEERELLTDSLASLAGINALLTECKDLYLLEVLQGVLLSRVFQASAVYEELFRAGVDKGQAQRNHQVWVQYVNLIASGQIIGRAAEIVSRSSPDHKPESLWLIDRLNYAEYLANQIIHLLMIRVSAEAVRTRLSMFFERSMASSPPEHLISLILAKDTDKEYLGKVHRLFQGCSSAVQAQISGFLLSDVQQKFLFRIVDRLDICSLSAENDRINAVAAYLYTLTKGNTESLFSKILLYYSLGYNLSTRRAILAAYPKEKLFALALQCMGRWADPMFIKHASIIDQEALTESILLMCAHIDVQALASITKTKEWTEGISNHLESTSERIRFLGMITGEAISAQITADPKKRLSFGVPDTQTHEAHWWRALIEVEDTMSDLKDLDAGVVELPEEVQTAESMLPEESTNISEYIIDESESSEDEFETMRIPDSDDEDSDEDPTLVDREKLRPPVYIRDLIKMMNNHDSYKHVSLALHSAPALIRRKADYGTELSDYAMNLVQIFAGLRDNFDMDDFQELRQEALKALVVACPKVVCPYLAQTFFTGDYSLQQRVIILSALGLGARELAAVSEIDPRFQNLSISKMLPSLIHKQYQSIQGISNSVQEKLLQPLAIEAAESISGPAALKVNKTTRKLTTPKTVAIDNRLTLITADYILFPLLGRFSMHAGKMIESDAKTFYEANLLAYYVRTVSLIFQVSAKSPALSRLTSEFWNLLISLRSQGDHGVVEALLLAFLIVIDTNDERRLALECARYLIETQEWCTSIFERVKEEKIQMLAAGVLIRIKGIVEANQVLMMQSATAMGNIGRGRLGLAGLK